MREAVRRSLVAVGPGGAEATVCFDPGLEVFRGHFPGHPLVPGVMLIEAVRMALEVGRGVPLDVTGVDDARFTGKVAPGERVTLTIAVSGAPPALRAEATVTGSDQRPAARIRLRLAERPGRAPA